MYIRDKKTGFLITVDQVRKENKSTIFPRELWRWSTATMEKFGLEWVDGRPAAPNGTPPETIPK